MHDGCMEAHMQFSMRCVSINFTLAIELGTKDEDVSKTTVPSDGGILSFLVLVLTSFFCSSVHLGRPPVIVL
jgi:hypothetical protein